MARCHVGLGCILMSRMLKTYSVFLGMLLSSTSVPAQVTQSTTTKLETKPSHSRLIFSVDPDVPVKLKPTKTGFHAVFSGIRFLDLGAPYGKAKEWLAQFKNVRDKRLASLTAVETKSGVIFKGVWK